MPDSERIAQLRPSYREELARGTGRFFLPARTDCPWCLGTELRRKFRTTDLIQGKPGEFVLDQCRGCGHIFQNPKLSQEGLDFYYRDFYDGLGAETTAKMFEGNGSKKRFRRSARALRRLALPGRWLDVGTSLGHFCATAKEVLPDTEFDGLDMGEGVEQAAKEGRVQEAYRGLFVDLADEMTGRYDAVSMFHYLEHTLDPHRELAAAHTALAPGGRLLIEVPDPESWSGRLLGRLWLPWFQPQHLNMVPMGNLCRRLRELGFTVEVAERRDAHIPADLACATWFLFDRLLPRDDSPWRPHRPGRAARAVRFALVWAAVPVLIAVYGLDQLLNPIARRTRFSNAYRVIARRDA
ncbi:class I SAM-dependent methyltransferase [Streptomyces sp. NPDC059161]|uniref:class I SAM-dependent methyltransferase n=1 Tax=Streptomyces sp. NPDC059161 TaxID=3346749 RepID=UPI003680E8B9